MLNEIHILAPAKLNLGLRVLPLRDDGFHGIESIFQTVTLADELHVSKDSGYGACIVECNSMELPKENTLTKAYRAFAEVSEIPVRSINVRLFKHIPAGGGLGGGSSDAASFVSALEKLHNIRLSLEQYDKIAGKIGSDVFFFLHCIYFNKTETGAAIVSGRGEVVKMIEKRNDLHFVLLFPHVCSSTKEAYRLVDFFLKERTALNNFLPLAELQNMYRKQADLWNLPNSFTAAITGTYSEVKRCLEAIRQTGALYSEMSGSGATVFGVFASEREAKNAMELLLSKGFDCVYTA